MDIKDLLNFAVENKPVEFSNAFDELMKEKITAIVDNTKPLVGKNMFAVNEEKYTDGCLKGQDFPPVNDKDYSVKTKEKNKTRQRSFDPSDDDKDIERKKEDTAERKYKKSGGKHEFDTVQDDNYKLKHEEEEINEYTPSSNYEKDNTNYNAIAKFHMELKKKNPKMTDKERGDLTLKAFPDLNKD